MDTFAKLVYTWQYTYQRFEDEQFPTFIFGIYLTSKREGGTYPSYLVIIVLLKFSGKTHFEVNGS